MKAARRAPAAASSAASSVAFSEEHRAPDFIHESEMGFSHRELLGALPAAVAPYQIHKASDLVYYLRDAGREVVLTLQPQSGRKLGAIALPVTAVKLEFFGFNATSHDDFMQRYKRYLHKGGG